MGAYLDTPFSIPYFFYVYIAKQENNFTYGFINDYIGFSLFVAEKDPSVGMIYLSKTYLDNPEHIVNYFGNYDKDNIKGYYGIVGEVKPEEIYYKWIDKFIMYKFDKNREISGEKAIKEILSIKSLKEMPVDLIKSLTKNILSTNLTN